MNDNQQLLLLDTSSTSPLHSRILSQEQNLLEDISSKELIKPPKVQLVAENRSLFTLQTWLSTKYQTQQNPFFWEQQLQDEETDYKNSGHIIQEQEKTQPQERKQLFPYKNLMNKLEDIYETIIQKQKKQSKGLFSSAIYVKSFSEYENLNKKPLKTDRNLKQCHKNPNYKKESWKLARKSVTQPDQERKTTKIVRSPRRKIQSYIIKAINQVEQKDSPRKIQKHRTKQQFLASITNWQERKRIKQMQMIKRQQVLSMAGVTFTPSINAKSKLLMKKKGNLLPIYQRQQIKSKKAENEIQKHIVKFKK